MHELGDAAELPGQLPRPPRGPRQSRPNGYGRLRAEVSIEIKEMEWDKVPDGHGRNMRAGDEQDERLCRMQEAAQREAREDAKAETECESEFNPRVREKTKTKLVGP